MEWFFFAVLRMKKNLSKWSIHWKAGLLLRKTWQPGEAGWQEHHEVLEHHGKLYTWGGISLCNNKDCGPKTLESSFSEKEMALPKPVKSVPLHIKGQLHPDLKWQKCSQKVKGSHYCLLFNMSRRLFTAWDSAVQERH